MNLDVNRALARARDDVSAAGELRAGHHPSQACSRAYFAAFFAASAALARLVVTRTKHSGVVSAFNEEVVLARGLEPDVGRILGWLFDLRNTADYRWEPVAEADAAEAIRRATVFVDAVEAWIEAHG